MKSMKMLIACVLLLALGVLLAADAGSLLNCVLEGLMMLTVTAVAVASALAYEKDGKRNVKRLICGLLFGALCFCVGSYNLVCVTMDTALGPQNIHLRDCKVTQRSRMQSFYATYRLTGTDSEGCEVKYAITRDIYEQYANEQGFSVDFVGWEKSRVMKTIGE